MRSCNGGAVCVTPPIYTRALQIGTGVSADWHTPVRKNTLKLDVLELPQRYVPAVLPSSEKLSGPQRSDFLEKLI